MINWTIIGLLAAQGVASVVLVAWWIARKSARNERRSAFWHEVARKAPAALFAVVASYGVYEFYREAVPQWVALVAAMSFESIYISLTLMSSDVRLDQRRYTFVVWSAVGMSVIANSLTVARSLLAVKDVLTFLELLIGLERVYLAALLGLLHGAPLSVLSYNFLQLLATKKTLHDANVAPTLHSPTRTTKRKPASMRTRPQRQPEEYTPVVMASETQQAYIKTVTDKTHDIVKLWNAGKNKSQIAAEVDVTRQAVQQHLKRASEAGLHVRSAT